MVTHEDATATRGNIFKSADLDLDSRGAHSRIRDPHRDSIQKADVSHEQRVRNAYNSCDWTEGEIDENQLKGSEHTSLQNTLRERLPADHALSIAEPRAAMAEGSFW